jgi:DNA-binding Lrp family transcriptional regulator
MRGPRPERPRLDRIDRHILRLLQEDGRITNIELARRVGISPPPCLRRVRALEAAGFIRGYHAELAGEALGFAVTVFAQIGLASQAETDLVAFEKLVAAWPEVREAHMLAGETDFLLKIVAADWDSYQRFLGRLTAAPNVAHVKSALVGEMVMDALSTLDKVAYVRFASVYKNFREAKDFEQFVGQMGAIADDR